MLTQEQLKELQEAIVKALGENITSEVQKQVNNIVEEKLGAKSDFNSALEDIKTEVKKLKTSMEKESLANLDEKDAKEIITKTFRDAYLN
jgi:hypothetical protein|nr:MAG TPA: hypothetical protein [Caudoviricetes sp.]